jgi:anti-sigma factor RsiW
MDCEEARQSLDAYADRELEPAHQLEIERHLAECVLCRDAVERITKTNLAVRMNMPVYKAPPELKSRVQATLRKEDKPKFKWFAEHRRPLAYAAALVVVSWVLASTWFSLSSNKDHALIAEAISNHFRSLMVTHLVDCASSDQYKVRPWFNGKLDYSPPVPDLTQAGYTLVGGRVDLLEQRPVAAIVYQHGKNVINLFVWPAKNRKIDMDAQSERGYQFCGWNNGGLNFFCISEISAADLETFEDKVREKVSL